MQTCGQPDGKTPLTGQDATGKDLARRAPRCALSRELVDPARAGGPPGPRALTLAGVASVCDALGAEDATRLGMLAPSYLS